MSNTWTVQIEEDDATGDLLLPLPEDLLKIQEWKEGDVLEWVDNNDGSWTLTKVNSTDL
jgi:hypothetical protein